MSIPPIGGNNPFLSGGLVLMALGAVLAYLREVPNKIWDFIRPKLIVSLTVHSSDAAYEWLRGWFEDHPYGKKAKNLALVSRRADEDDEDQERKAHLVLGPGTHLLRYRGAWMWVHIERERKESANMNVVVEQMHITVFRGGRKVVEELVAEARTRSLANSTTNTSIMTYRWDDWSPAVFTRPRALDSLVFADRLSEELLTDINLFRERKGWYQHLGIPYRRGYLLYGEPGNGKSSLVLALAGHLGMSICILNLNSNGMDDEKLVAAIADVPRKSLLLLEDIDAVFNERDPGVGVRVTFTGLLNTLDGVAASEGRLLFMTTNRRDVLDQALIRPGRCDRHLYVGNATHEQAQAMYLRFFPGKDEEAVAFADQWGDGTKCMAIIQEKLIELMDATGWQQPPENMPDVIPLKQRPARPTPPTLRIGRAPGRSHPK